MRELLSHHNIPYEERNIAENTAWRAELEARIDDILVPTLVSGSVTIVGFDLPAMQRLLGLDAAAIDQGGEGFGGLPAADAAARADGAPMDGDMAAHLRVFLHHLEHEMRVNAAKGDYAYRHGVHDGLRFAADGLRKIIDDNRLPNDGGRALPHQ